MVELSRVYIVQGAFLPVPPIRGGAVEKLWYEKGKIFAAHGYHVTHLSRRFHGLKNSESINSVEYVRLSGFDSPKSMLLRLLMDFIYSMRVLFWLPREECVVITNTFWLPWMLGFFSSYKVIVDVARMPKGQLFMYKKVRLLRATSTAVMNLISKEVNLEAVNAAVIPNPLTGYKPVSLRYDERDDVVLYVGRVHSEKGLNLLAEFSHRIANTKWKLLVVGPYLTEDGGEGVDYLNQLKSELNMENVEFFGPIYDHDQLLHIYMRSKIFVYPSVAEMGETFGLSALEAMSMGCSTVVSDLSCFRDFVVDGVNGLVFDHRSEQAPQILADMLCDLMERGSFASSLGREAMHVNSTHSIDAICRQFEQYFN